MLKYLPLILLLMAGCSSQKTVKDRWSEPTPPLPINSEYHYIEQWVCANTDHFERPVNAYLTGEWNDYDTTDLEKHLQKELKKQRFHKDANFYLGEIINRTGGRLNTTTIGKNMIRYLINQNHFARILTPREKFEPTAHKYLITGEVNAIKKDPDPKKQLWRFTANIEFRSDKTIKLKPLVIKHECRFIKVKEKKSSIIGSPEKNYDVKTIK